jgi:hypothetical protein
MTRKISENPKTQGRDRKTAAKATLAAAIVATAPFTAHGQDAVTYAADGGLVVQLTQFETTLSFDEMVEKTKDQIPQLLEIEGLIQVYYLKLEEPNGYGAIHIWASAEALNAFREGEIATNLGSYFQLAGPPTIQVMPSVFRMRDTVVQN